MEVGNAVNSQHIIWFMQGIYYERLTSAVLWMNCSNLCLMWNIRILSLLYSFHRHVADLIFILCLFWKLYIINHTPSSHYKVTYMNCFAMPTSLTKYASCSTWKNLRHQVWSSFCVSSVFCIQVAWQSWWQFWSSPTPC